MTLTLFNTLTREEEEFEPIEEGTVRMYSCGQTIYDDLHVGNARAYVAWDTLRRYLEWKGYTVRHVQNITDVGHLTDDGDQGEDKVEQRARELGLEPMELVEEQLQRYFEDTQALNVPRQDIMPRATGHINEMIHYVKRILDNGYAYERDGNVYFDVEAFAEDHDYGVMAKKDLEQLKEEAEGRVEPDPNKKNQFDFALWLEADENHAMQWDSPWSRGYPGWHLECTVMSQKYLGDRFDIHTGGKDHIFPHHPNERAQAIAATGEGMADTWLHNEFVTVEGEKMAKSEGNFYTVRELLDDYDGDAIRLYLLSSHYRSPMDFSIDGLEQAAKELSRVRRTVQRIDRLNGDEPAQLDVDTVQEEFREEMDDDLNTARAKQALMEFVGDVNAALEDGKNVPGEAREVLIELFNVLGVDVEPDVSAAEQAMADLLLGLREQHREQEEFETADRIRAVLDDAGFAVEDTGDGAIWLKK
ncbi:MAG: cysteine--tRNA ligase [Candidatus Nanohaloarchaea archaeon]|nr:cysteine--tRNA ligase [Candidatus Nanohaloarchaea archaeon]